MEIGWFVMLRDHFRWCKTQWRSSSNLNNRSSRKFVLSIRINFIKTRLIHITNKYTLNERLKFLAPQIWREYFWWFNGTCALSICFWGFSCQGKIDMLQDSPIRTKEVEFLRIGQYSKEPWRRIQSRTMKLFSDTSPQKNKNQHIMSIFLQLWKVFSRSRFSSQTDATAVFSMESSAFSEKRTDICLLLVSSIA